ncbi:MAG: DUF1761 domain-containing protein [Pacificibacter sp.]|uniref:DUF1761 domain-containing protein n=1 Tax=Pacificibacter sp. TaxID=1917866 RepID=UPI003218E3E6
METTVEPFNILAVIVGAIVAFLVGWIWYGPLFGKKWAEGSGVELGSASSMPIFAMVAQFVALLTLSIVVGITATTSALFTALFAILAAALFVTSAGAFVKKSNEAIAIDFGFIVIAGVVMILCQGLL